MLEVSGLRIAYGAIEAVGGVSFRVPEGALVALLGGNGAGKTTILRALSGLIPIRAGVVRFLGQAVNGLPPHEIVRRGLIQTPEGRRIFPDLTVAENLVVGAYSRREGVAEALDEVMRLFPRLAERAKQRGGTLSGGEQQMLAVGRALMSRPKLLMLDEPSLGLAPIIVDRLYEQIDALKSRMTILLVEQNTRLALDLASHAYILRQGRLVEEGDAAALKASASLRDAYLGV
jgi:branched-chain amino acid transport system ATP-binding protein